MELSEMNLTPEQLEQVTAYTEQIRSDLQGQIDAVTGELNKYKPIEKTDAEKALEERLKALEDREREIANKERLQAITSKLQAKGLPTELASMLTIGEDVDADIEKVATVFGCFATTGTYQPTNHVNSKGITKEQFKTMNYIERTKLYQENPELYKALSK